MIGGSFSRHDELQADEDRWRGLDAIETEARIGQRQDAPLGLPATPITGEIEFRDLIFSYGDVPILAMIITWGIARSIRARPNRRSPCITRTRHS